LPCAERKGGEVVRKKTWVIDVQEEKGWYKGIVRDFPMMPDFWKGDPKTDMIV
jgi:hypothetical protein